MTGACVVINLKFKKVGISLVVFFLHYENKKEIRKQQKRVVLENKCSDSLDKILEITSDGVQ